MYDAPKRTRLSFRNYLGRLKYLFHKLNLCVDVIMIDHPEGFQLFVAAIRRNSSVFAP